MLKLLAYLISMDKQLVLNIVEKANYVTVDNDRMCFLHETLREISSFYPISHTTISKALKEKNTTHRLKNIFLIIIITPRLRIILPKSGSKNPTLISHFF
mgnify:CR=1 FL=1